MESPFELYWSSKDKHDPSESQNDLNDNELDRKIIVLSFNPCKWITTQQTLLQKLKTLWISPSLIIPKIVKYYYKRIPCPGEPLLLEYKPA